MTLRTITSALRYIAVKQGYETKITIDECVNSHAHPNVKAGIEMPLEGIWRQYELIRSLDYLRSVRLVSESKVLDQIIALASNCAYMDNGRLQETESLQYVWALRWFKKILRERKRKNENL